MSGLFVWHICNVCNRSVSSLPPYLSSLDMTHTIPATLPWKLPWSGRRLVKEKVCSGTHPLMMESNTAATIFTLLTLDHLATDLTVSCQIGSWQTQLILISIQDKLSNYSNSKNHLSDCNIC